MISVKKCTIKESSDELNKKFYYPRLTNIYPTNNQYELFIDQINKEILENVISFKSIVNDYNHPDYYAYTDYKVYLKKRQLISVLLQATEIIGAEKINYINTYNYDISKNKEIQLSDIFREDSDYIQIIINEIENQINEYISKLDSDSIDLYFDESDDFIPIYENQTFYVQSDKVVICFSSYELDIRFPMSVKISINFEDYKEYLTDYTINEIWEVD